MIPINVLEVDDPRVQVFCNMRTPAFRQKYELAEGYFVVEGVVAIGRMLRSVTPPHSLLLHHRMWDRLRDDIEQHAPGAQVFVADRTVLEGITGFDLHRGALASGTRLPLPSLESLAKQTDLLCVVEGLNDGENLGAIARSARAFGVGGLVIDPTTIDPLYRRTIRVSMGEMLFLPFTRVPDWPSAIGVLRSFGFHVAAFTPAPDSIPLYDWRPSRPTAVLLGAEGPGLTQAAMQAADVRVHIPIAGDVDSLNVGHAAAVAFAHLRSMPGWAHRPSLAQ